MCCTVHVKPFSRWCRRRQKFDVHRRQDFDVNSRILTSMSNDTQLVGFNKWSRPLFDVVKESCY